MRHLPSSSFCAKWVLAHFRHIYPSKRRIESRLSYHNFCAKSIFSYTPRKTKDINKSKYKFNIFSNKLKSCSYGKTFEGKGIFFFFLAFAVKLYMYNPEQILYQMILHITQDLSKILENKENS